MNRNEMSLAILLVAVAGLGLFPEVTSNTSDGGPDGGRLHTDGRWIRDTAGNTVRLKGATVFWNFRYSSPYSNYDPLSYTTGINETSLDTFKSSGANFIRLTVNGWIWYVKKAPSYVAAVDTVIGWSKTRGIMVVLENGAPWYDTDHSAIYKDQIALTIDPTDWKDFMVQLAERYKTEPTVIGFDLLNEPRAVSEWAGAGYSFQQAWDMWRTRALEVVRAIHAVDSSYLCFVEPLGSSAETDDMDNFKTNPLPEQNIVYSAHNYYSWDYPWFDYAKSYGDGDFGLAKQQMEALYYQRFLDMLDAGLPVVNMESGIYRNASASNPNWEKYMDDALSLYEKYGAGVCWYTFDPDRQDSSLISLLSADRTSLTAVGSLWAVHMTSST